MLCLDVKSMRSGGIQELRCTEHMQSMSLWSWAPSPLGTIGKGGATEAEGATAVVASVVRSTGTSARGSLAKVTWLSSSAPFKHGPRTGISSTVNGEHRPPKPGGDTHGRSFRRRYRQGWRQRQSRLSRRLWGWLPRPGSSRGWKSTQSQGATVTQGSSPGLCRSDCTLNQVNEPDQPVTKSIATSQPATRWECSEDPPVCQHCSRRLNMPSLRAATGGAALPLPTCRPKLEKPMVWSSSIYQPILNFVRFHQTP